MTGPDTDQGRDPAQEAAYQLGRVAAIVERASGEPLPLTTRHYLFTVPHQVLPALGRIAAQLGADVRDQIADALASVTIAGLEWSARADEYATLGYYHERGRGGTGP